MQASSMTPSIQAQKAACRFHLENGMHFPLSGIARHKLKVFPSQQKLLKPGFHFHSI